LGILNLNRPGSAKLETKLKFQSIVAIFIIRYMKQICSSQIQNDEKTSNKNAHLRIFCWIKAEAKIRREELS